MIFEESQFILLDVIFCRCVVLVGNVRMDGTCESRLVESGVAICGVGGCGTSCAKVLLNVAEVLVMLG